MRASTSRAFVSRAVMRARVDARARASSEASKRPSARDGDGGVTRARASPRRFDPARASASARRMRVRRRRERAISRATEDEEDSGEGESEEWMELDVDEDADVSAAGGRWTTGSMRDMVDDRWENVDPVRNSGDDIIADTDAQFVGGDWLEPTYKEVNAPVGSMLEKVQRMHLNEPSDFSFKDGEYFDLMGYVKHKTDNEFCLVLEVAERARERKIERLENMDASSSGPRLPPIQQAIADLALEIESSGGKTSAYLAMREAADRARLRYELQQASWCWDNYCEDSMRSLGVSERAEQMLHEGQRVDEAMDFERELMMEDMAGSDATARRY